MLKSSVEYPNVPLLYSSPMLRCRQTAKILFPDNKINIIENLREYDFEGKTAHELEIDPAYLDWTSGKATANGRGYTILVDPSIYSRTGAVEVIDLI